MLALTVYIFGETNKHMDKKSNKKTKVYAFRFPESPKSRFHTFKEKMDAYAKALKKELIGK